MIRYLETYFRNRWIISMPALLLLLTGAGLVVFVPKKYEAAATIWVEESTYFDIQLSRNAYLTPATIQANRFGEFMNTYTIARTVVDQTPVGKNGTEAQKEALVDEIHKGLFASTTGDHIVRIRFFHRDPNTAVAVVKSAIDTFNRVQAESANAQAAEAIAFYQERVKTYETQILPRSKKAVSDYLDANPEVRRTERDGGPQDPNFALIQAQFQQDREQYDRYVQKLEEIQTRSNAVSKNQQATFRVLDQPGLTDTGGSNVSKKTLILYSGVGVGISIGYVLIFLLLATELDNTARHPGDIRRSLKIPVLEVIPDYTLAKSRRNRKPGKGKRAAVATTTSSAAQG